MGGLAGATNPTAMPSSKQEVGSLLREQAETAQQQFRDRQDQLYTQAGALIGSTPAVGTNTVRFLNDLGSEITGLGNHARLTAGPVIVTVQKQAMQS